MQRNDVLDEFKAEISKISWEYFEQKNRIDTYNNALKGMENNDNAKNNLNEINNKLDEVTDNLLKLIETRKEIENIFNQSNSIEADSSNSSMDISIHDLIEEAEDKIHRINLDLNDEDIGIKSLLNKFESENAGIEKLMNQNITQSESSPDNVDEKELSVSESTYEVSDIAQVKKMLEEYKASIDTPEDHAYKNFIHLQNLMHVISKRVTAAEEKLDTSNDLNGALDILKGYKDNELKFNSKQSSSFFNSKLQKNEEGLMQGKLNTFRDVIRSIETIHSSKSEKEETRSESRSSATKF